jgi:hypothetical protein
MLSFAGSGLAMADDPSKESYVLIIAIIIMVLQPFVGL